MTINPDFDFQIGKNTRLRGLVALALILAMLTFAAAIGYPRLQAGFYSILHQISATKTRSISARLFPFKHSHRLCQEPVLIAACLGPECTPTDIYLSDRPRLF